MQNGGGGGGGTVHLLPPICIPLKNCEMREQTESNFFISSLLDIFPNKR